MLRVNSTDPDLADVSFDINGNPYYLYQGQPFTGIMEIYNNGVLIGEFESDDGSEWGLQKGYYSNGSPEYEYYTGTGGLDGPYKEWDANGNLTRDQVYINGVLQP